jgi:hypothetical protein
VWNVPVTKYIRENIEAKKRHKKSFFRGVSEK